MPKIPNRIEAPQVAMYLRFITIGRRVAEETAPELFKHVGWAVAISAIEIVRRKTNADWLLSLEILLAISMFFRMQSKFGLFDLPEKKLADGSIEIKHNWPLTFIGGLVCWGLTIALTVGLANLVADSELLQPNVFLDCR